jgi:hypothetical protein
MTTTIGQARELARRVIESQQLSAAGVALTVREVGDPAYVLWAIGPDNRVQQHELDVGNTDEPRLTAHARGFADNHQAAWAARGVR